MCLQILEMGDRRDNSTAIALSPVCDRPLLFLEETPNHTCYGHTNSLIQ
ncbi:hypothetical protein [Nostoc sp. UIC 10630]|nr:hypothetical protein [Nostoc sp. UIC 10630]NEU77583.1 hypothetical protein [Nostoc sp. UIC 10630]